MYGNGSQHDEGQAWVPVAKNVEKSGHFSGECHATESETDGENQTRNKCRECCVHSDPPNR
jgi:hypothetical protein